MSLSNTYLFYDIETSGLSKSFDQIFQFAAIRTDLNFNEIERHEIFIHPKREVIPSPIASITHRIDLDLLQKDGLSEYQAMKKIHHILNTPGTISLGYNTLTFDDEFLRFSFYRNLLTPYTHQYANQCSRMDLYPMLVMYYLFNNKNPPILNFPMKDGAPSLKLENIATLNQLSNGLAHNAMVDVEATLNLAKILKKEEKIWEYLSGYFHKKTDEERISKLESTPDLGSLGLLVLPRLGTKFLYQAPVLYLGQHLHYKNQYNFLRLDLPELLEADFNLNNIPDKTFVIQKKLGEVGFLLPYTSKYQTHLKAERINLADKNLNYLRANPALLRAIQNYWGHFKYPIYPNTDIQARLYQSNFWTPQEIKILNQFHHTPYLEEKTALLSKINNLEIKKLGERLLAREHPTQVPEQWKATYEQHLQNIYTHGPSNNSSNNPRPIDFTGKPQYGLENFEADLESLTHINSTKKILLDDQQKHILTQLSDWIKNQKNNLKK